MPWKSSSLTSDFYFRPGGGKASAPVASAPATTDPVAYELAFWEAVKNSSNPADYQEYLNQYPNGRCAGLARVRVRSLQATPVKSVARDATIAEPVALAPVPAQPDVAQAQTAQVPVPPPTPQAQPVAVQQPPMTVAAITPACKECGILESIREVVKEASASGLGAILGGLSGALVGNTVTGGNNRTPGIVVGALGGDQVRVVNGVVGPM